MEWFSWRSPLLGVLAGLLGNFAEAERVHDGQRSGAHGGDDADARGRALEGLNIAGVVVAFNLESAGPAIANVDDAGVFAWPLNDAVAPGGEALEMDAARFIGAMLAPHYGIDEFGERGTRPSAARMRSYSSAVMLCAASNCGVTEAGSGTTAEGAVVITVAFIVARDQQSSATRWMWKAGPECHPLKPGR